MHPAPSVDTILADPIGHYFAGRSFVVWFQPRLAGAMAFDRLHSCDEPQLARLLSQPVLERGYDLICDFSGVELFDQRAFELLDVFLDLQPSLLADLARFAFVRPPGLAGSGLAGLFHEKVQPVVEARLFASRAEALDWLGYPAGRLERQQIDDLETTFRAETPALRRLRAHLLENAAASTLHTAAVALGTSDRSLQRELAAANTSFRTELCRARLRIAESLLVTTDDKIETIAHYIGFASASAFTTVFTRILGETPQEFRRRRQP